VISHKVTTLTTTIAIIQLFGLILILILLVYDFELSLRHTDLKSYFFTYFFPSPLLKSGILIVSQFSDYWQYGVLASLESRLLTRTVSVLKTR